MTPWRKMIFLALMMMQLVTMSNGFCNQHNHHYGSLGYSISPITTTAAGFRRPYQVLASPSVRPWWLGSTSSSASSSRLFARKKKKQKTPSTTFDRKELQNRIKEVTNPYHQLFAEEDWNASNNLQGRPDNVWIILFKPDTDEQGLHTIEYPPKSGSNFVLAFESKLACDKFAATLEAQNSFGHPSPKLYDMESLDSFCDMLGVFIQVVPEGKEILPPTRSVQAMGEHNRNLKDEKYHLDYIFDMFELEVDELGLLVVESGSWE